MAAILLFAACSNSVMESSLNEMASDSLTVVSVVPDSLRSDMLRVSPAGATVLLGSNGAPARGNEKPEMRVKLDYDFSLGVHEVSCGEFENVAQVEYWGWAGDCDSDSLPVTGVSFYDAVLYANAYSKLNGYDTCYTYFRRVDGGNGVYLEGLTFHPESEGFRLPTEAEWVLAASLAWNPSFSWNATNSNSVCHEICAFRDSLGFCDLAGNALELTNDWLGSFRDTTVENYAGAPFGNSLFEKVVKGGTVSQSPEAMNLYSRGDVYTVSASTASSYMGFRLAFGAIPHVTWMDAQGRVASNPPLLKASSADIRKLTGTVRAKLAFRNGLTGNLAYIDYRDGNLNVVEISDTLPVYHPDISPDGSKAAFCTGLEGVKGKSALYVRNLDPSGSGLVKLDVESAAIPRWHVDVAGDTSIIYVDDAGDNSSDADFFSKGTWKVPFANGKFGSPKKIFDGAYHGGVASGFSFAVSGSKRLRARVNGKDEVWLNGEQACNASLSKDGFKRTLFLDFGSEIGREFAQSRYAVHERLLVVDSSGNLIGAVPSPVGTSFDHSEWVDRVNLAVVTLVNALGAHSKIAAVNVGDSSVVELVESEELWHPCLWVMSRASMESGDLDLDSAGVYRDAAYDRGEATMNVKMRMFWDSKDSLELIAIGSSRTERGFDPLQMSMRSFNYGFIGGDIWASFYLAENYILPHAKNLKYLVMEISPELMQNAEFEKMQALYAQAPGYIYDRNHGFWKEGLPHDFIRVVDQNVSYSSEDSLNYVNTLGLLRIESYGWGDEAQVVYDTSVVNKNYRKAVDSLIAFVERLKDRNVTVVGLVYPQSPLYANTGSFGRHGVKRSVAMETFARFDSLAQVYPHFIMVDENKFGAHDYTDAMANDFDHLSALGAEHLSARLDSLLKKQP